MGSIYPHIAHLPGSRTAGDRTISLAQARRCTEPGGARAGDVVIVEEKLDGSCVGVRLESGGRLVALGREGRDAAASPNEGRRLFAQWAGANATRLRAALRNEGDVLVGEWLALVHGTRYALPAEWVTAGPFVVFDLFYGGRQRAGQRAARKALRARAAEAQLPMPGLVHEGGPIAVADALSKLGAAGFAGALDPPEGLVYRVERGERSKRSERPAVAYVTKWVRHDKVDGALLPERTGKPALWNWRPS